MEISVSAENFRRLRHTEEIAVKPLTVLVGRNSSGKSTFLRLFPLIRQSVMTRTSSPLLWYGDLADFGDYSSSISDECDGLPIRFRFGINIADEDTDFEDMTFVEFEGGGVEALRSTPDLGKIYIEISVSPNREKTYISTFKISVPKYRAEISITSNVKGDIETASVNGSDALRHLSGIGFKIDVGSLFPTIAVVSTALTQPNVRSRFYGLSRRAHEDALFKLLRGHLDQRTKDKTVRNYAGYLLRSGLPGTPGFQELAEGISRQTLRPLIEDLGKDQKLSESKDIFALLWLHAAPRLLRNIVSSLERLMRSVLYIGPARARSDRYYRYQDLSVSEIDPDGKNFPMFLNSLSEAQIESLSLWIQKLYGFGISVAKSGGHLSIFQHIGEYKTNIVDTGYGVSQILPVLGQLWWSQNRTGRGDPPRSTNLSILAIEQPELHLHPAHQALLADALVDLICLPRPARRETRFLIETHSETFVNRLGELVGAGAIPADSVQILLFEQDDHGIRATKIRKVDFNEKGFLINWPFGFFLPAVK